MRAKLTKTAIDAIKAAPGKRLTVWDVVTPRFAVRVTANGVKTFIVKYRAHGRQRFHTIGRYGAPWTVELAREEARRVLGDVAHGQDPAATKIGARTAPTVADVADRFIAEHLPKLKSTTQSEYTKTITAIIKPKLGARRIADVTRADVSKLHHAMRATPAHANRVVMLLSKLANLAEAWGLRPDGTNPVRHVVKFRERRRERYLTEDELGRLGAALDAAEREGATSPWALAAIRLAVLTGARRGELLTLRWDLVELERGRARLPEHKTDRAGAKTIALNAPAVAILEKLPRIEGNPFVFPSAREGKHLADVHDVWAPIRAAADLEDVRFHDLRHSHASVGVSEGISLPIVGRLLGHTAPATTQRYAHVAPDPVRAASELIGQRIAAALKGRGT